MVTLRGVFRLIGVGTTIFLAHLLTPDDIGVVALAWTVLSMTEMASDFSLGAALIRLRERSAEDRDTAWTLGVIRGAGIAILLLAIAGPASRALGEPRVEPIIWLLAACTFLQSFENIRLVDFSIEMRFEKIFQYRVIEKIIAASATVTLALIMRSYWALIISFLVTRLVIIPYSYILRPHRPRFALQSWRKLFGFSKWMVLTNILFMVDTYLINFLLTWVGGARAVGLFQVSYQVAALPASEIAAPIRTPIYAGFAKLLDNQRALAAAYAQGFGFLVMIITPLSVGIALLAQHITMLAFGPVWAGAAAMIPPTALYALFDACGHYTHNLFTVLNRQSRLVAVFALFLCVRVPSAIVGGYLAGPTGAVYAMAATAAFSAVLWTAASLPLLSIAPGVILRLMWRSFAACAAMAVLVLGVEQLLAAQDRPADPDGPDTCAGRGGRRDARRYPAGAVVGVRQTGRTGVARRGDAERRGRQVR